MGKNNSIAAFAYLRVSSKGQIKGHGFHRQSETIEEFAKRNGYVIKETFRDAFTGTEADRPDFNRMVGMMLGNGVLTILVESLDRLARDVMVQSLLLSKLAQHGFTLINCITGEDVTASMDQDPMRKALIQIQSVFSELEKNRLVAKLRRARQAKKKTVGKCEGRKAFGEKPGEEQTVQMMHSLRRKRNGKQLSFARIAAALNEKRVPTRTGARWQTTTVRNILGRSRR
ncbi:MAG TPA: recombinase family protein [Chthoniobacterales bacterium]|nr:recombinase family protein [Chthoniobacterales bacterium]